MSQSLRVEVRIIKSLNPANRAPKQETAPLGVFQCVRKQRCQTGASEMRRLCREASSKLMGSCAQVPMGDAKFPEVKLWKKPLLLKASKRLCTDERFQFLRVEVHKVSTLT